MNVIVNQPQTMNCATSPTEPAGKQIMDEEFCRLHTSGSQDPLVSHSMSCTLLPSVISSKNLCCSTKHTNLISPIQHEIPLSNFTDNELNHYTSKISVNETSTMHSSDDTGNYEKTEPSSFIFNGEGNSIIDDGKFTEHGADRKYHGTYSECIEDDEGSGSLRDFTNTHVQLAETSSNTDSDVEYDKKEDSQYKIPDIAVDSASTSLSPSSPDENSNVTKPSTTEQTTAVMEITFKKPPSPITRRGGVKRNLNRLPTNNIDSNSTSLSEEDQSPVDVVIRKNNNEV